MKLKQYITEVRGKWAYVLQDKSGTVFSITISPKKLIEIMNRFTKDNYTNGSLYNVEVSGKDTFGEGSNKITVYKLPIL